MTIERALLRCGISVPIIYYANLVVFGLLNPTHDPVVQPPSYLGTPDMRYAELFNLGLMLVGVTLIAGAVGLFLGLRRIRSNLILVLLTSVTCAIFGVAMAMAGLFPMPSPLHTAFGLEGAGILTALFGAIALGPAKETDTVRTLVFGGFTCTLGIVVVLIGVPGVQNPAKAGLWALALTLIFPTIALLCFAVTRRLQLSKS
jgi:hypothetical membrane protein